MNFWYVYILRSLKDSKFYIGITNNLKRRLDEHRIGKNTSTAKRIPLEIIYFEAHRSKKDARRREQYFKTTKGKTTLRSILRDFFKSL
ncbi:GIY-YIG nuclease family protein [Candidatus Berkelbacteria bacterium]|nr:GIY-YIG nuclease family protein [Candidatus Berkelbacteria bacterium]